MISIALRGRGAAVRVARGPREATELLREHVPDVLVVAAVLPDEDGAAFLRRVRRTHAADKPLAVALTAEDGARQTRRLQDAGYQAHLTLPVAVDDMVRAIADLIFRQEGPNLPRMRPAEVLDIVRSRARVRDYSVSDAALARMHDAGYTAADILHALSDPTSCEGDSLPGRYRVTGPSLIGTEVTFTVTLGHDGPMLVVVE